MARKPTTPSKIGTEVRGAAAPAPIAPTTPLTKVTTEVRNSPIPKTAAKKEITHAMIAERAYFISTSGQGGSECENWLRAEKELKA